MRTVSSGAPEEETVSAALVISLLVGGVVFGAGAFVAFRMFQAEEEPPVRQIVDVPQAEPKKPDLDREWVSYNHGGA